MKKLVQLNVVCNGSTGRIMCDIANYAKKSGYRAFCFYGRGLANKNLKCIKIGNILSIYFHVFVTRVFNKHGHGSYFATKKMIRQIKNINPDVIHLHNIHGYWINIKVLFKYLKNEYNGKVIWTLHDCWSFTGHCAHFTAIKCNKWQSQCYSCPQLKSYPKTFLFDTCKKEYNMKKKLFSNIKNLTIVTPSNWLASVVKKSFLNQYPIKIVENGVDLNLFKPTYDESIKEKYNIPKNKKIWLGVANVWEEKKGLNIFFELSKMIDDNYIIVLVGLTINQIKLLPKNIVGIERTNNIVDLVKLYTIADVFVNPSVEETFSLVTVEAMACGTPVVVSNASATKDLIENGVGSVVENESAEDYFAKAIVQVTNENKLLNHVKKYKVENNLKGYFKLYEED